MNKEIFKKWWFWALIILFAIPFWFGVIEGIIDGIKGEYSNTNNISSNVTNTVNIDNDKIVYNLKGEELGEYGKKITLNANTDLPVDKYLYKIPVGKYKVTTTNQKMTSFFIVKDDIVKNKDEKYSEELNIVESYLINNSDDIEIELKSDESIQIIDNDSITLTKINN
jgi:hypothetical protein